MSEYRPTEYIVDFGDYRSNQFVRLNMSLIEQNSARLGERIVRCRDCHYVKTCDMHYQMKMETGESADDGFCAWGVRKHG